MSCAAGCRNRRREKGAAVEWLDLQPQCIPIGKEAKALWIEWHDRHARELVDISNDDLAAHYAKLKGACARIALLFACVGMAAGGDAVAYISADAMRRAIAVVEWFKGEGRRVYAVANHLKMAQGHAIQVVRAQGAELNGDGSWVGPFGAYGIPFGWAHWNVEAQQTTAGISQPRAWGRPRSESRLR